MLYGIYGYIVLSLSLIPDLSTRLMLVNKLSEYIANRSLQTDKNLSQMWYLLGQKYFSVTNIPTNVIQRFTNYSHEQIKNI